MNQVFRGVTDDNNRPLKIYSEIKDDSLKIIILRHTEAWSTDVDKQEINNLSKMLSVSPEKYFEDLASYLQSESENVSYKVEEDEFILYYKTGTNIRIKYFFHNLSRIDYFATVDDLLDKFFKDRTLYLSEATKLKSQNSDMLKRNTRLEEKLQELVNRKQEEEDALYSSFVLVLNEKKRQIQHLRELLEAFRQGRPTLNPPVTVKVENKTKTNRKNGKKTVIEVKNEVSESDDSPNEHNTDDEKPSNIVTLGDKINIQPSTSKDNFGLWNNSEACLSPKMEKLSEKGNSDEEPMDFNLLDSDDDGKLNSLPKKKKKIYHGDESKNSLHQREINHKSLNSSDHAHHSPSETVKSNEGITEKMRQECNLENPRVRRVTHTFTTLSNNSVPITSSTMSTVGDAPDETSITYDTQELLDRI